MNNKAECDIMSDSAKKILIELLENGRQSRAGLAKKMKLSRPAISAAASKLLTHNFVKDAGLGDSSGGKPPMLMELVSENFVAIGVDLGNGMQIRGLLYDGNGDIIDKAETEYSNSFNGIVEGITKVAKQLCQRNSQYKICGLGLAVPGVVDTEHNEVESAANFDVAKQGIEKVLAKKIGLPVYLTNRARAAAMSEWNRRDETTSSNFVYINFDFGIGAVAFHNGMLDGKNFSAGEIRDLIVPRNDSGIISYAPLERVLQRIFAEYGTGATPSCYRRYLTPTAYLLRVFIAILDPDKIILGGRFMLLGEGFLKELRAQIRGELADKKHIAEIHFNQTGLNGVAAGAAFKVIKRYVYGLNFNEESTCE